jgi:2-(1,2-epoxy-1,2-dihydrophenyl)acetyl-CoA isomerase
MVGAMSYTTLLSTRDGAVATITLNRPHNGNAMDGTMCRELMDAVTRIDVDRSVRAVLLNANGKLFCGGGDLLLGPGGREDAERAFREYSGYLHLAVARLLRLRAPVIVAVQGVAAGAGVSLAIAGDLVLAAESARFTLAYTKAGLVPDGGATYALPRLVGLRRAQELLYTNRVLSAAEALDWGLITRVVPDAELAEQARALAHSVAAGPSGAFEDVKRLLLHSSTAQPETQMELESRGIAQAIGSADGHEGVAAFREKRAPKFGGK